jgi:two-component system response regulator HydG
MINLILIDKDSNRRTETANKIRNHGIEVHDSSDMSSESLTQFDCLVIVDEVIRGNWAGIGQQLPVIVLAAEPTIKESVSMLQAGAMDYLALPTETGDLLASIERATAYPKKSNTFALDQVEMVGSSEVMKTLRRRISKVGPTDSSVLILGQSGTGKELVAQGLHASSDRAHAPMITLNCATVPQNLIEAELFGAEAYGDNKAGNRGLVEAADGGTLFLDEISELPPSAQARLIQVAQGENRKVGGANSTPVNVRIIAASHRDLQALTESGAFRSDLFYRLNVVSFNLSSLRNRHQDILEIGEYLLSESCRKLDKPLLKIGDEARKAMLEYHWPGNVRELGNAIERAVILADEGSVITKSLLAIEPDESLQSTDPATVDPAQTSLEDYFVRFVQDNEVSLTETELAEKLGISRKSLWERRQRLNIPRKKTRNRGLRGATGSSN